MKMNMYMRFVRSDIDPVCISMCRPGFYNKNAMYDTKSLQLTYILIITTGNTKKESHIWIKGVTYLHEI